jgi:hypothetical protein
MKVMFCLIKRAGNLIVNIITTNLAKRLNEIIFIIKELL